jgi:NitT/TauT family transport system permease protein
MDEILAPIIALLKSIPIASFVVLLLIWIGSDNLAIFVSILVVLPNAYLHTVMGLKNTDRKLLEMASVFQMSFFQKFRVLYMPAMIPFLISCMEISIGMSFKSGVAAEVIGTPAYSFGEKLYMAKIQLNTPGILAWTIVIILASYGMEKGILFLLKISIQKGRYSRKYIHYNSNLEMKNREEIGNVNDILIENLSRRYQDLNVISKINLQLKKGGIYCLMGPSGCGKTTFFHLLLGIIEPDYGEIKGLEKQSVSAVFQEPRLLEEYTAIENAFLFGMFSRGRSQDIKEFQKILPAETADKLVKELSGGMQQRVAILRAMSARVSLIVLDEPFNGLDEVTKKKTADYILEKKGNRIILVSTHSREDAFLLKGEIIDGNKSGFNWNYGGAK